MDRVWEDIRRLPGQSSGICFSYFRMLSGDDDRVKADRMLCRFVGAQIGLQRPADIELTRRLMIDAAHKLGMKPRALDYAVWDYQRGQKAAA